MTDKTAPKPPMKGALKAIGELIAASMQEKAYEGVSAEELRRLIESGQPVTIVDCRDVATFAFGHIEGAVNVPYRTFMENHHLVPKGAPVVAACYVGFYSRAAAQKLATSGHPVVTSLVGGMQAWIDAGFPLTADEPPIE